MLGAHNGLAQRKTATQMHQQNPQIGLGGFILAQSPQSARGFSLLSPIGRKERHQQVPIFSEGVMRRVFHTPRLLQVIAPVNKQVSAYGPTAWVSTDPPSEAGVRGTCSRKGGNLGTRCPGLLRSGSARGLPDVPYRARYHAVRNRKSGLNPSFPPRRTI